MLTLAYMMFSEKALSRAHLTDILAYLTLNVNLSFITMKGKGITLAVLTEYIDLRRWMMTLKENTSIFQHHTLYPIILFKVLTCIGVHIRE